MSATLPSDVWNLQNHWISKTIFREMMNKKRRFHVPYKFYGPVYKCWTCIALWSIIMQVLTHFSASFHTLQKERLACMHTARAGYWCYSWRLLSVWHDAWKTCYCRLLSVDMLWYSRLLSLGIIRCPDKYEFSSVMSATNPIESASFISLYSKINHCIFRLDGTQRFITYFIGVRLWSLSCASLFHSIPSLF